MPDVHKGKEDLDISITSLWMLPEHEQT